MAPGPTPCCATTAPAAIVTAAAAAATAATAALTRGLVMRRSDARAVPCSCEQVEDADEDLELGDDVSKGAVATRFASAAQVLPPKPSKVP